MSQEVQVKPANAIDSKILSLADTYSPTEISVMLGGGVSPTRIAARVQTLLKDRDWLTDAQEDALITWKMRRILLELEGRALDLDNALTQLKLLKEIGARLDKRREATTVDLNRLYGNQALIMGQAIELALQKALQALRQAHPDLAETEVREALKLALPEAVAEIQSRTAADE